MKVVVIVVVKYYHAKQKHLVMYIVHYLLKYVKSLSYLRTCHTNLWSSIDMNAAVRLTADAASNGVGNADNQSAMLTTVTQRH